jgi:hypothetical protein
MQVTTKEENLSAFTRGRFVFQKEESMANNNGFFDRPADERAERMRDAAERGGVENFFDLPPEERAQAYEKE